MLSFQHEPSSLAPTLKDRVIPRTITDAGEAHLLRFIDFFAAHLENRHTADAYVRAIWPFLGWCEAKELRLTQLRPPHISQWVRSLRERGLSAPSVKARLAAVKSLFRFFMEAGLLRFNPAADVRGPKVRRRQGKTPQLEPSEMRRFLDAIEVDTLVGLRDRALLGTMAFAFPRVSTALRLKVADFERSSVGYTLYLLGKGGEAHRHPVHHEAATYLLAWLEASSLSRPDPIFQSLERHRGQPPRPSGRAMHRRTVLEMVKRRAARLGLDPAICTHTFRGTGLTAFAAHGGSLEMAAKLAGHADVRTTQLYVRVSEKKVRSEVERIRFE